MEKKDFVVEEIVDLNLAAYLIVSGFQLLRPPISIPNQKYKIFQFEKTPEFEQACVRYFNRNAQVDALTICETIRSLLAASKSKGEGR
jgi:hypothetical protein